MNKHILLLLLVGRLLTAQRSAAVPFQTKYFCGTLPIVVIFNGSNGETTLVDWRRRTFKLFRDRSSKLPMYVNRDSRVSLSVSGKTASLTITDHNYDCTQVATPQP